MSVTETWKLPDHFVLEPELREQLSHRPGHQRCIEGAGELLLVAHDVPRPGIPERESLFFWKRHDGSWLQPCGTGLDALGDLLDRYAQVLDGHEEVLAGADTAAEVLVVLRHAGPLARATRNLVQALEQALAMDQEDREIRGFRDRARELERAADLLHADGRVIMEFRRAEQAEQLARSAARLNRTAIRLNLLVGFFLPLVALGTLLGMNANLPGSVQPWFRVILLGAAAAGILSLWLGGRQTGKGK